MTLALDQFRRAAFRPDRLPDAPHPPVRHAVLGDEVPPDRDDPRRVAAHRRHVLEPDPVRVRAQLGTQHVDLVRGDRHQHRLVAGQPTLDEREGPAQELGPVGVQQGLVAKRVFG
ncbi:hypothetical protein GTS_13020 [Gandjariella thermophila]|uniref:Uncharacterized protein n=1 Tax=Gandjariella thermophila TaxID=1931992 RepID=A0A4D4J4X7_9PSEU|nr:hypothetical protein [Gandjariella thermophila]GDY29669.1 hypothetical protein GTS_13020 [Gandjariella thermophila]